MLIPFSGLSIFTRIISFVGDVKREFLLGFSFFSSLFFLKTTFQFDFPNFPAFLRKEGC